MAGCLTGISALAATAFTKEQALLLKKTTNNIILCFDGDNAGDEATDKAIQVLKEIDVTPRIIRLKENLDPDEYILKYGKKIYI
jgi:DNA primase